MLEIGCPDQDKAQFLRDNCLANFTKAAGLYIDMSEKGYGVRCRRFSMLVEDGVVKVLNIDAPGTYELTSAEAMLVGL